MKHQDPVQPKKSQPQPKVVPVGHTVSRKSRPVIIRKSSHTPCLSPKIARPKSSTGRTKVSRSTTSSIGISDITSSIQRENDPILVSKRPQVSMAQKMFFDASIAIVTISFMMLTIAQL